METVVILNEQQFLQLLMFFLIFTVYVPFLFRTLKTPLFIMKAPKVTEQGGPTWPSTTGQWSNREAGSSPILSIS